MLLIYIVTTTNTYIWVLKVLLSQLFLDLLLKISLLVQVLVVAMRRTFNKIKFYSILLNMLNNTREKNSTT